MFEMQLIDELKKYECIYNKDHIDFRNKEVKENCWYAIETAVQESEEKCRLRWKTLRERYVREFIQMNTDEKYKSQWRFIDLMSFMQGYIDPKPFYGGSKDTSAREANTTSANIVPRTPKKFEQFLLSQVKKYQYIYDKDHPDFRNKTKKEEAWINIARSVGATERQCRNRYKTLRERFVHEHLKSFVSLGYKSEWKFFNLMSFMMGYVAPNQTRRPPVFKICKQDMYCRTCFHEILNNSGQRSCKSLNIYETSNFANKLEQCSNIQIEPEDDYPNSVCDMCYEKILDFHQFQLMCRDSLQKFRELQTQAKYEHDFENTTMDNSNCLTGSTNKSYLEQMFDENEADTSSQESEELDYLNESADDQIEVKWDNQLDVMTNEDPLAEQLTSINTIYEIITPAEVKNEVSRSEDGEWIIERIRHPRKKAKSKIKEEIKKFQLDHYDKERINLKKHDENVNIIKTSSNEIKNITPNVRSTYKRQGKSPKVKTIEIKRQAPKDDVLEDEYDDGAFYSDDSISADEIKANTSSKRLIYKCDLCPKTYDFKYRLQAHQRTHKALESYSCTFGKCQRRFSRLDLLEKHLSDHNTLPVYICDIGDCERMYKTLFNLRQHKKKFHNYSEPRPCEVSGTSERGYTCEICGKTFSLPLSLRNHRFIHVDKSQWPFTCDVEECTKKFQSQYFLKLHKQRHAGIRNHICPYCGIRTVTLAELNRHINIHTFERKYPCPFCPKVSKSSGDRGNHIRRVHEEPKVYPCRICDGTFTSAYNRDHHEMAHKGIKPYSCDVCNKKFKWKTGLKMHTKIIHLGAKPYECEICGKEFLWYGSLTKHRKTHLVNEAEITQEEYETNEENLMEVVDDMDDFIEEIEDDSNLIECTFEIERNEMDSE